MKEGCILTRLEFSTTVKRTLQAASFNRCMICKKITPNPEAAHIIPASKDGPRSEFRSNYDDAFIISVKNALNLCRICHSLIDDKSLNTFSLDELFEINKSYLSNNEIGEEYLNFFFTDKKEIHGELVEFYQNVLHALDMNDAEIEALLQKDPDYTKIEFEKKLEKNKFSRKIKRDITFMYSNDAVIVRNELKNNPIISFKINAAISTLYVRCATVTDDQNEIYNRMIQLMYNPTDNVVDNKIFLNYFFIICEVFLK